jgi:uncharacterized protein (DUF2267 family)
MPEPRVPILDETVSTTNVLRAGLRVLRERLTADEAVHLGQQLPTLVRGIYFEKWRPAATPVLDRSLDAWLATLKGHLLAADADAVPPGAAARALFGVLKHHIDDGVCRHLQAQLPGEVADLLEAA